MTTMLLILIFWLVIAATTAIIAHNRNRNPFGWFLIGLCFSGFGLLLVIVLSSNTKGSGIVCPSCRSDIDPKASVCPRCTRDVDRANVEKQWLVVQKQTRLRGRVKAGLTLAVIAFFTWAYWLGQQQQTHPQSSSVSHTLSCPSGYVSNDGYCILAELMNPRKDDVQKAPLPKPLPSPKADEPTATPSDLPTAPPTLKPKELGPLSKRIDEIKRLVRLSIPIITRHCGTDVVCSKQQTAAMYAIAAREIENAKATRNPMTYTSAALDNDVLNSCIVQWGNSEDFVEALKCINDAGAT